MTAPAPATVVVVSGPSCVGKTTFLRHLRGAIPPPLPGTLRLLDLPDWPVVNAMDLMDPVASARCPERIVLHYDIFRPITFYGTTDFSADPVLDLVRRARNTLVLTLWESPDLLRQRSVSRQRRLWQKVVRRSSLRNLPANIREYREARARRERMRSWFASPDLLASRYDDWFDFVDTIAPRGHWLLRPSDGFSFIKLGSDRPPSPVWSIAGNRIEPVPVDSSGPDAFEPGSCEGTTSR